MIHGCLPTSVTTHPASIATKPRGALRRSIRVIHLVCNQRGLNRMEKRSRSPKMASQVPIPTIIWKAKCTIITGGQFSRGNSSRPLTTAFGSLKARTLSKAGIFYSPANSFVFFFGDTSYQKRGSCAGLKVSFHRS